ncbi:MAG TPA: hypothetical protein PK031_02760 [Pseudomonadales bacterium]|nr:hypothetical protein [Pseudomonadales bacterium]
MLQAEQDYVWHVQSVSKDGAVTIRNISTDHLAALGSDHIRNFDTDIPSEIDGFKHGFLTLKGVAIFKDGHFIIEPNR